MASMVQADIFTRNKWTTEVLRGEVITSRLLSELVAE